MATPAVAGAPFDGRWAADPSDLHQRRQRRRRRSRSRSQSLAWPGAFCAIGTSYRVRDAWHISARCWGEGTVSNVPIRLQMRGDRLVLDWAKRAAGRTAALPMSVAGKAGKPQRCASGQPARRRRRADRRGDADESGMRRRPLSSRRAFPGLSFSHIQRIIRKGELRVNGKRAQPKDRLQAGQAVRIPPLQLDAPKPRADATRGRQKTRAFLKSITLYEDADVLVLNKPMGLAVQGGSGTTRHLDGMLDVLRDAHGQRPRLVHRLDKDTAGCLLVAKTRFAAAALAKTFRSRSARKIYWALVAGVPKPRQGRISTFLAKEEREDDSFMRIARTARRARATR